MEKEVSIIIPVYNDQERISKCLDACINQSTTSLYEIVVIDNGSSDGTFNRCLDFKKKHRNLVRLYQQNLIQSAYASRNSGIEKAKGSILVFTDSDCIPSKQWLETGVSALKNQKSGAVAGKIEFFFKSQNPNIWEYIDSSNKLDQKSYVENAHYGATANLFVFKDVFKRLGTFNEALKSGGDYEFGQKMKKEGIKLSYKENAVVYHPARATFTEKLEKTKRIAQGQRYLDTGRALKNVAFALLYSLKPVLSCPQNNSANLSAFKKLQVVIILNALKLINVRYRFFAARK
ncbi:MAG: glycosyltransferase [Chitinivibrionales bacterium]|nr:glycosyltransferase [Chitinivibrionales bacterium]